MAIMYVTYVALCCTLNQVWVSVDVDVICLVALVDLSAQFVETQV